MKCKHALHRLLATSGRRKLSPEVLNHVQGCKRCQRWQAKLAEIDRSVPQLPVPDSQAAKADLVRHFLAEPAAPATPWWRWRDQVTWQRVVISAAAVVLFALLVSGVFNREPKTPVGPLPPDDFLAEMTDLHNRLATARDEKMRVEGLAALADRLDARTRNVARVADAADLNEMALLYEIVVKKGLVGLSNKIADDMPAAKRKQMIDVIDPVADRLLRTGNEVEELSGKVPPSATASLKKIASVAKEAQQILRKKVREEKLANGRTPPEEGKS
jgi:hypothetical protein